MKNNKRVASLTLRQEQPLIKNWRFIIIIIVLLVIELSCLTLNYHQIPASFPTRWNLQFEPIYYMKKKPFNLLLLPIIQFIITAVFTFTNTQIGNAKIKIDPAAQTQSLDHYKKNRLASTKFLFSLFCLLNFVFFSLALALYLQIDFFNILALIFVACSFVYAFHFGIIMSLNRKQTSQPPSKNGWRGNFIYYNKTDASIVVEKKIGLGYTLNMARYQSWFIILGLLLPIAIVLILYYILQ